MTRVVGALAALLAVLALTACGEGKQLARPDVPPLPQAGDAPATQTGTGERGRTRIVFVTHGQASDPFWAVVRRGIDDAARQLDVSVSYQAPDSYDVDRMSSLIDAAVATHPDGIVVSLPDPEGLAKAVRHAIESGVPVVSINSGSDAFRNLGIPVHVGQAEYQAGLAAGRRLAGEGIHRALCVIHEGLNQALAERCRGIAKALEDAGADVRTLTVDLQDPQVESRIALELRRGGYDGMVTLGGAAIAGPALAAIAKDGLDGKLVYATFGIGPDVLHALEDGELRFAVDQQPYLQGYLPVVMLTQYRRYGILPADGTLVPTGPVFVTPQNAAHVLDLVGRGLR